MGDNNNLTNDLISAKIMGRPSTANKKPARNDRPASNKKDRSPAKIKRLSQDAENL